MSTDASGKKRAWNLITLNIARDAEELASAALFDMGTSGIVTLEEAESSVKLGAYFDQHADMETIARSVEAELARAGLHGARLRLSISDIRKQDWMQK